MANILVDISKYVFIAFVVYYTANSFLTYKNDESYKKSIRGLSNQRVCIFLLHLLGYILIFIHNPSKQILILYLEQLLFFVLTFVFYNRVYPKASKTLLNNMCFLLSIGFIILTRLSINTGVKQFNIAVLSAIIASVIPYLIYKFKVIKQIKWSYGAVGILLLLTVLVFGRELYGAKNWIVIGNISFQPSEIVKITFIFFMASFFKEKSDFKHVFYSAVATMIYLGIFIFQNDLGTALIFFMIYIIMLYIATSQPVYLFGGLASASIVARLVYNMFYHVKVRVEAWLNPWKDISKKGYQIAQSLFAIGSGGWFGLGLYKGLPNKIPVVETDFIFSAIAEELGSIIGICIILLTLNCYLIGTNIAYKISDKFYKLIAIGISTAFGFQVFLIIGGVTKLIPLTGVTLPFVSYGGSSLLSSMLMFSMIQGLYILQQDEDDSVEKKNESKNKTK